MTIILNNFKYALAIILFFITVPAAAVNQEPAGKDQRILTPNEGQLLTMKNKRSGFSLFKNLYEPSGVIQIANQQLLVVDDELKSPLILFELNQSYPYDKLNRNKSLKFSTVKKISDLEGLTRDKQDYVYTITSHSRTIKDKVKNKRNRFIRFKITDSKISEEVVIKDLRDWLIDSYPIFKTADVNKENKASNLINIEGIAYNLPLNQLYIGMRSPLDEDGKAIIVPLDKPAEIFQKQQLPEVADELIHLDLKGAGIRAMCYDSEKEGFFIISGSVGEEKQASRLWFWESWRSMHPVHVTIEGVNTLGNAEGITPVRLHNGDKGLLIVNDDGSKAKQRSAGYMFIPYKNLNLGN